MAWVAYSTKLKLVPALPLLLFPNLSFVIAKERKGISGSRRVSTHSAHRTTTGA